MIDTYRNKPNLPDEDGPEFIYGAWLASSSRGELT